MSKTVNRIFSAAMATGLAAAISFSTYAADARPGEGKTVTVVETAILEEAFQARIMARALSDLGYTLTKPLELDPALISTSIANGDGDVNFAYWEPLHSNFYNKAGGDQTLAKVGTLLSGALQGYLVDKASYDSGITNIGQLQDPEVAKRFDNNGDGKADLAGCVPGWGCEGVIEHHMDEYELRETVTHDQGVYSALIANVMANNDNGQPVLYYTWTPYWVSGELVPGKDVEWLEVPYSSLPNGRTDNTQHKDKNLGFAVNDVRVLANLDFLEENPAAQKLFEIASIDINDVSRQNSLMRNGEKTSDDVDRHVADWISKNQALYNSWLEHARQ